MEWVEFKAVLSIKEQKTDTNENKEGFIDSCKNIYKEVSELQKYRKKIAAKITKRKAIRKQACQAASSLYPEELKGHPV